MLKILPIIPIGERDRPIKPRLRMEIFQRDGGKCRLCGDKTRLFGRFKGDPFVADIDHVIPRSRGGRSQEENLQLLCRTCNRRKYFNA